LLAAKAGTRALTIETRAVCGPRGGFEPFARSGMVSGDHTWFRICPAAVMVTPLLSLIVTMTMCSLEQIHSKRRRFEWICSSRLLKNLF
jgi:hypothetical protein